MLCAFLTADQYSLIFLWHMISTKSGGVKLSTNANKILVETKTIFVQIEEAIDLIVGLFFFYFKGDW